MVTLLLENSSVKKAYLWQKNYYPKLCLKKAILKSKQKSEGAYKSLMGVMFPFVYHNKKRDAKTRKHFFVSTSDARPNLPL